MSKELVALIRLRKIILPLVNNYPATKRQVLNDLNCIETALKPQKTIMQYGWKKVSD